MMHISENTKRDLKYGGAVALLLVGGYFILKFIQKPAPAVNDSSVSDAPNITVPQLSIPNANTSIEPVSPDQINASLLAPPTNTPSSSTVNNCAAGQLGFAPPPAATNFYASLANPGVQPADIITYASTPVAPNPSVPDFNTSNVQPAFNIEGTGFAQQAGYGGYPAENSPGIWNF